MAEPTAAMNAWMKDAIDVDVARYKAAPGGGHAGEKEGGEKKGAHGEAAEPEEEGHAFAHDFPIPVKTMKVAGGRVEISLSLLVGIACQAAQDKGGSAGKLDPKAIGKAAAKFIVGWSDKTVMPAVSGGAGLWKSLKVERSGVGLVASAETETSIGKFALEFTLIKLSVGAETGHKAGASLTLKAAEASATLTPHRVGLPDVVVDGIRFSKITLQAGGQVTLAPDWPVVLGKWAAKEVAEDAALEAGEVAATVVGAEVVIAGSLIAVGLATIFGTLHSMAQGAQIGDLAVASKLGLDKAKAGFKLAMSGYKPPSDPLTLAGYQAGLLNRQALLDRLQKQYKGVDENDLKEAIAGHADEAVKQAEATIQAALRTGLWDGYLAANTRFLTHKDGEWAYVACFGNLPKDGDAEWKKFTDHHSGLI